MKNVIRTILFSIVILQSQQLHALEFSLFGDITYRDSSAPGAVNTFALGQLDLFTQQKVSDTSSVTAEIVFEDPGDGFEVDIERLHINKKITNMFTVAGGRFHIPLGMWNINFHHGSLIQDTISRPSFLEFEDAQQGIFPEHIVGLYIDGKSNAFNYQLSMGNSPSLNTQTFSASNILELEVRNSADVSNEKTATARIAFTMNNKNTELGFSTMSNKIAESGNFDAADPTNSAMIDFGETLFEQQAVGIDFSHNSSSYYIFAEYFQLTTDDNQNITSASITPNPLEYTTNAYYIQLGKRFGEKLTTVIRHEDLSSDDTPNTYLNLLGISPITHNIFGINYKIEESHAIKIEYQQSKPETGESFNTISAQWFFLLI